MQIDERKVIREALALMGVLRPGEEPDEDAIVIGTLALYDLTMPSRVAVHMAAAYQCDVRNLRAAFGMAIPEERASQLAEALNKSRRDPEPFTPLSDPSTSRRPRG